MTKFRRGPGGAVPRDPQPYEQRYALRAAAPVVGPGVIGLSWWSGWDRPAQKGNEWWVGLNPNDMGTPGFGHAMCCLPRDVQDIQGGWGFYDQGQSSMCAAYSGARMQAINNRVRKYDAPKLYARCKQLDGYPGEGTYIEVVMDVLRTEGIVRAGKDGWLPRHGIRENRWAGSVEEILRALGESDRIALLQSWGLGWPRVLYLPAETLAWIWARRGNGGVYAEYTTATDRPTPRGAA